MNPLQKTREGVGSAWRKSRDGSKRTAGWVTGGIGGAFGKARASGSDATVGVRDAVAGAADRSGGASLWQRAKANGWSVAAIILGGLLLVTWIAWTVYVWSENGSAAGLGVLISWPAVIAALALIAAPFVVAAVLIRRMSGESEPALAGAAGGSTETAAVKAEESEDERAEDQEAAENEADDADEGDEGDEAEDEQPEDSAGEDGEVDDDESDKDSDDEAA